MNPVVITVTGSESTGKTTLASDLARHFATVWVPEYSRIYADEKAATTGAPLDVTDVEPIARGQIALEDRALASARGLVIRDTDLVSTTIYARHYYGACPAWIDAAAKRRRADLYLLCDIDVPWVADDVRDSPHAREHMQALFVRALDALGVPTVTIRGSWADRLDAAIAAVSSLDGGVSRAPSGAR